MAQQLNLFDARFAPAQLRVSARHGGLILATVLAIGSYLAFIVVLKLQFPVWPAFITG